MTLRHQLAAFLAALVCLTAFGFAAGRVTAPASDRPSPVLLRDAEKDSTPCGGKRLPACSTPGRPFTTPPKLWEPPRSFRI